MYFSLSPMCKAALWALTPGTPQCLMIMLEVKKGYNVQKQLLVRCFTVVIITLSTSPAIMLERWIFSSFSRSPSQPIWRHGVCYSAALNRVSAVRLKDPLFTVRLTLSLPWCPSQCFSRLSLVDLDFLRAKHWARRTRLLWEACRA